MLIVEDGTCPAGANSYETLETADAYLVARGLWPETPIVVTPGEGDKPGTPDAEMVKAKEAAMVRAFDWLNALPGGEWMGWPVDWQRTTAWPRKGVPVPGGRSGACVALIPSDMVPQAVAQAQMELAGLIYGGMKLLEPVERGGAVAAISESSSKGVDVLQNSMSRSVTYADNAPLESFYPSVIPLIALYLSKVPGKKMSFQVVEVRKG